MACVLLDVDGTLFDLPSTESRFVFFLMRHGQLGVSQLASAGWFYLRWLPRNGRDVGRKNKAYLNGLACDRIAALATSFVREELYPRLRSPMLARLREHREAGDRIFLLTGTPEFIAAPLARILGAESWIATRCEHRYGCFTAQPPLVHPYGPAKLVEAQRLCAELHIQLKKCIAYADAASDAVLLRAVGRAIAVQPDPNLRAIAQQENWEILDCPKVLPSRSRAGHIRNSP